MLGGREHYGPRGHAMVDCANDRRHSRLRVYSVRREGRLRFTLQKRGAAWLSTSWSINKTERKTMKVDLWKLSDIKPYPGNPRHNDQAVDAVAASIQAFGFLQPIVVDEHGVIVVGHTRYKAALKLGLETVPVHVATYLTPAQVKAYRIADNKTAELASWNQDLLLQEILNLQQQNCDLAKTGFSAEELSQLLDAGTSTDLGTPTIFLNPPTSP
jgi:hypothetical protein